MRTNNKLFLAVALSILFIGFRGNPPDARTGAPGDSTCATTSCHTGNGTDIDGSISLMGLPSTIESGTTYNLTIRLSSTAGSPQLGGFQMTALDSDNSGVGNFSNPGSNVGITTLNDRQYVDHRDAKSFSSSSINYGVSWTAPSSTTSATLTFYVGANFVNGNGGKTGDRFKSISVSKPIDTFLDEDSDGFNSDVDCNDMDSNINPDATEIPNNEVDENCDGVVEMIDEDSDGFNSDTDCNDLNADINPDATEIPNNDVDENCDGVVEVIDLDEDGFNSDEDCNDTNPNINPDAMEIPNNEIDEDCDGEILIEDLDNDGFNALEDCDDSDANVNPNAFEIPNNDVDEDCDGEILIIDNDGDGFNSDEDCNDMNASVHPDADEVPADGIDNNCDGAVDECICTTEFDPVCGSDGVTYNNSCEAECAGITTHTEGACDIDEDMDGFDSESDCNDMDAAINPDATEIPDNDVDENCDGIIEMTSSETSYMGSIKLGGSIGLSNVVVTLSNGTKVTTDSNGSFSLINVPADSMLSLSFSRNDNHANGVSALDLVLTINHILGKKSFDGEVQLLAADADGNGAVSALDLVHMINVILGRWTEFSNRESWGFIPESIMLSELQAGEEIEIEAYKVGDVNGSALPN